MGEASSGPTGPDYETIGTESSETSRVNKMTDAEYQAYLGEKFPLATQALRDNTIGREVLDKIREQVANRGARKKDPRRPLDLNNRSVRTRFLVAVENHLK